MSTSTIIPTAQSLMRSVVYRITLFLPSIRIYYLSWQCLLTSCRPFIEQLSICESLCHHRAITIETKYHLLHKIQRLPCNQSITHHSAIRLRQQFASTFLSLLVLSCICQYTIPAIVLFIFAYYSDKHRLRPIIMIIYAGMITCLVGFSINISNSLPVWNTLARSSV